MSYVNIYSDSIMDDCRHNTDLADSMFAFLLDECRRCNICRCKVWPCINVQVRVQQLAQILICQLVHSDHFAGILNTAALCIVSSLGKRCGYIVPLHTPAMVVVSFLEAAAWLRLHPHWCAEDGAALPARAGLLVA